MVHFGISRYFFGYPPARPSQQQHPAPALPPPKVLSKRSPKIFRNADLRNKGNSYLMNISGMKIQHPVVGLEATRRSQCSDAQQYNEEQASTFVSWCPSPRDTACLCWHMKIPGVQISFIFLARTEKLHFLIAISMSA